MHASGIILNQSLRDAVDAMDQGRRGELEPWLPSMDLLH
jgi:hypothetical protein